MKKLRRTLKKLWHFIWEDNSIWSWIANIVIAFVLIKFIVYPGLGFAFSTSHPVVAVVSESMEHDSGFDEWWEKAGKWYAENNIKKENFSKFPESYKRIRIGWIAAAKHRPAIFRQRLGYFLKMTSRNKRFGMVQ